MLEAYIHYLRTEDPGLTEPTATRERLKDKFPRGSTRRMTLLGMLIGSTLEGISFEGNDSVVYASTFGESRALEEYLQSFPGASPTLFQTSIHPSAVQQALIARQRHLDAFFPMTGGALLAARAIQTALLLPTDKVVLCGGEEKGTGALKFNTSERSFAFAMLLSREPSGGIGRLALETTVSSSGGLELGALFDALHTRQSLISSAAPGLTVHLSWL